jgi:hypothetical protein
MSDAVAETEEAFKPLSRCEYHSVHPSRRGVFAGTRFVLIHSIFGKTGMIVRCTCPAARADAADV